jgi:hypothetical protein
VTGVLKSILLLAELLAALLFLLEFPIEDGNVTRESVRYRKKGRKESKLTTQKIRNSMNTEIVRPSNSGLWPSALPGMYKTISTLGPSALPQLLLNKTKYNGAREVAVFFLNKKFNPLRL